MDTIRPDDRAARLREQVAALSEADCSPRTWSLCGLLIGLAIVAAGLVVYATLFHGCERAVRF